MKSLQVFAWPFILLIPGPSTLVRICARNLKEETMFNVIRCDTCNIARCLSGAQLSDERLVFLLKYGSLAETIYYRK